MNKFIRSENLLKIDVTGYQLKDSLETILGQSSQNLYRIMKMSMSI